VKVEKTLVIDTQYLIISCIFTKENEAREKKKNTYISKFKMSSQRHHVDRDMAKESHE